MSNFNGRKIAWIWVIFCLVFLITITGCGVFERQVEPFPTITPKTTPTPSESVVENVSELGILTIHYLDVGQGDCTFIEYGEVEIVIDAGKNSSVYMPYLELRIDGELEALIASHPDADHIGDLDRILDTFNVSTVYDSGDTKTTLVYKDYWNSAVNEGCTISYPKRGDIIQVGGLDFLVLNPEEGSTDDYNGNSIALLLQFGEVNFYFMADVEEDQEKEILDYFDLPKAHYLKAGHHGSKTSSSDEFLDEISPSTVIYSAGRDNSYGHPHDEAIQRWTEHGAFFTGTDMTGYIIVVSDGTIVGTELSTEY